MVALLVCAALYAGHSWYLGHNKQQAKARPGVPVTTMTAGLKSFPVVISGLGTVQRLNSVTTRTRVDGQIDKIAFKEGQIVNQGDLLAEIDPAAVPGALDQAKAKKAQDEANLPTPISTCSATKLGEFRDPAADRHPALDGRADRRRRSRPTTPRSPTPRPSSTTPRSTPPITGVAGLRQVDQGNIVNASTQTGIVTIAQIEPIAVIFTAPEEQLPDINEAHGRPAR